MKNSLVDRVVKRLMSQATPEIRREMRAIFEGQSQWERVVHQADQWIELPSCLGNGSGQCAHPLKVRPANDPANLLIEMDKDYPPREVKVVDLRRMLTIAEESWG